MCIAQCVSTVLADLLGSSVNFFQKEGFMNVNFKKNCKLLSGYQKVIKYDNIFKVLEDLEKKYFFYCNSRPLAWIVIDEDIFEAVGIGNGYCKLMPMSKDPYLYRGQTKDYGMCVPIIYRSANNDDDIEYFIQRLRAVEFELILKKHPAVIELNNTEILNCRIQVDFLGLAQHYGLSTDCLDITNNFYIAAFFACCKYDKNADRFIPKTDSKEGIIYYISPIIMGDYNNFDIVGLQPFSRPAEQKAFRYKLNKGDDFAKKSFVQKLIFSQTSEGTDYIYRKFDNGNKLFPYDFLKNKVDEIKKTKIFSKKAFLETYERFRFTKPKVYYQNKLKNKKIIFKENTNLCFNSEETKELDKLWKERRGNFFKNIGFRRVRYPD